MTVTSPDSTSNISPPPQFLNCICQLFSHRTYLFHHRTLPLFLLRSSVRSSPQGTIILLQLSFLCLTSSTAPICSMQVVESFLQQTLLPQLPSSSLRSYKQGPQLCSIFIFLYFLRVSLTYHPINLGHLIIILDRKRIPVLSNTRCLGLILGSKLTWFDHFEHIAQAITKRLNVSLLSGGEAILPPSTSFTNPLFVVK